MTLGQIHKTRIFSTLIGVALGGFIFSPNIFAQSYTAFDIGTLGGPGTYAAAINATGQITGNSDTSDFGPHHAFVTQANGLDMTDLGTLPGGNISLGFGIMSLVLFSGYQRHDQAASFCFMSQAA